MCPAKHLWACVSRTEGFQAAGDLILSSFCTSADALHDCGSDCGLTHAALSCFTSFQHGMPCTVCSDLSLQAIWARLGSSSGSAQGDSLICITKHARIGGLASPLRVVSKDMCAAGLRLDISAFVDTATCAALLSMLASGKSAACPVDAGLTGSWMFSYRRVRSHCSTRNVFREPRPRLSSSCPCLPRAVHICLPPTDSSHADSSRMSAWNVKPCL